MLIRRDGEGNEREKERQTERKRDRQRERQTDRQRSFHTVDTKDTTARSR